jgi:hypothetical protein
MKTYRVWFLDWSSTRFYDTGEPLRYRDYEARSAADALRKWTNHFEGYAAERVELVDRPRRARVQS